MVPIAGEQKMKNHYFIVEYSRTGKGAWHTEMRTPKESEALACYDKNVKQFGKLLTWRVVLMREIVRSK